MTMALGFKDIFNRIALGFTKLKNTFVNENTDHYFSDDEVARLHQHHPIADCIDEQTWQDLLVADYFSLITRQTSIFGKQVLHQRLRQGLQIGENKVREERLQFLMADPDRLKALHAICKHLRLVDTEIAGMLFSGAKLPTAPAWLPYAKIIPFSLIFSMALMLYGLFISVGTLATTAFLCIFPITVLLFGIQLRYRETILHWNQIMYAMTQLLGTCSLIGLRDEALFNEFSDHRKMSSKIVRKISRLPMQTLELEKARDYLDWFFLGNVSHYFDELEKVEIHLGFIQESFFRLANLEADIAIARHLLTQPIFCWATLHEEASFQFHDAVHPLLENATPLSIDSNNKSIFLSGQNGIGKSTLLRTIGINLITARAFGFCYAMSGSTALRPIYASLQNEDSLLNGESLYVSELRRAHELLATIKQASSGDGCAKKANKQKAFYIIDEIFRGTNYLESVSAAAAVLQRIALHGTVIVSSHNLVLAAILHDHFFAKYVARNEDGNLTICDGVLPKTNGISLLVTHGFTREIEADANKVFQWLSQYLSHPTTDVDIFTTE